MIGLIWFSGLLEKDLQTNVNSSRDLLGHLSYKIEIRTNSKLVST